MGPPTRTAYDEAILPGMSRARLRIPDPEIKEGQVEMVQVGPMKMPHGLEGGMAIVYKFRTRSGHLKALRFFKFSLPPDMQFRYERLGPYFRAHAPEITAGFRYHPQGIVVRMENQPPQTLPVVEMDWIDGVDLKDRIDDLCQTRDRAGLKTLTKEWVELISAIRQAQIGHGDLSGDNVMVRLDGGLALVDYDGVFIPDFQGREQLASGKPDYQHPGMSKRPFDANMDIFSALVVYVALLALQAQPELWDRYAQRDASGKLLSENLLFEARNYLHLDTAATYLELRNLANSELQQALNFLREFCESPLPPTTWPPILLKPGEWALYQLEQAIESNNDERIIITDKQVALQLRNDAGLKGETRRLNQAKQRVMLATQRAAALAEFRAALASDDDIAILERYRAQLLDSCINVKQQERERLQLARDRVDTLARIRQALKSGDERQIAQADSLVLNGRSLLTPAEWKQVEEARAVARMPQAVRQAIAQDDDEQIVSAYRKDLLRLWMTFTPAEQTRLQTALKRVSLLQAFRQALMDDRDPVIIDAFKPELEHCRGVTQANRDRLDLARRRVAALGKLRLAIKSGDDEQIAMADVPLLGGYPLISGAEQRLLEAARRRRELLRRFRSASQTDDDEKILTAYDQELDHCSSVTEGEHNRLMLARTRRAALAKWREVLRSDDDMRIVWEMPPILEDYAGLTAEDQARATLAGKRIAALQRFHEALETGDDAQILSAYDPVLDGSRNFSETERDLLMRVRARRAAYEKWRQALERDDDEQILAAYDAVLEDCRDFVFADRKRLHLANRRIAALRRFHAALASGEPRRIVQEYDHILDGYKLVRPEQWKQLEAARSSPDIL